MKAPHFWSGGLDPMSREAAPLTRVILTPFEKLYIWGFRRKLENAQPDTCDALVICVGNVTVGGTGKTPIVGRLREGASAKGLRCASLSRGYGGNQKGPLRVDPQRHSAKDVGDEPLMLAQSGESWIGRDRAEAGRAMAADGVDVIIMDDGYQNHDLKKDYSVLIVDSENPVGNGYCIPKGPMRETFKSAHDRCSDVILVGDATPKAFEGSQGLAHLRARITPLAAPPTSPLIAFAGIGRPQKFFDSLDEAGGNIVESVPYGDHHVYSQSDLSYLRKLSEERNAQLITTTKDFVRLSEHDRNGIVQFPIVVKFDDENAFAQMLDKYLAHKTND